MRNLLFTATLALILFSCNFASNKKLTTGTQADETGQVATAVEVDSLVANPNIYLDQTVNVKGLVVHTCKHSGKKMFLVGSDKNKFVKVIAGPDISRFDQSLEGEIVVATGKLTLLDETQEKHEGSGERKTEMAETSDQNTTSAGCVTETKIKNYQMICDGIKVVE